MDLDLEDLTTSLGTSLIVQLSMTLSDPGPSPVSRSQCSLKANISQTVHATHGQIYQVPYASTLGILS